MAESPKQMEQAYSLAKERYAVLGVDVETAISRLSRVAISLHCWQGDDVGGFEKSGEELGGGLAVTGNYPGKARTPDELRADLDQALSLIPGTHRLEPARLLRRTGRPARGAQRDAAGPFPGLDRLGQGEADGDGLQSHLLSPIPRRPTVSRWRIATKASAGSGSSTASPAARSGRRWAKRWARPA